MEHDADESDENVKKHSWNRKDSQGHQNFQSSGNMGVREEKLLLTFEFKFHYEMEIIPFIFKQYKQDVCE